jgi:hypothetical protein
MGSKTRPDPSFAKWDKGDTSSAISRQSLHVRSKDATNLSIERIWLRDIYYGELPFSTWYFLVEPALKPLAMNMGQYQLQTLFRLVWPHVQLPFDRETSGSLP